MTSCSYDSEKASRGLGVEQKETPPAEAGGVSDLGQCLVALVAAVAAIAMSTSATCATTKAGATWAV